MRRVGSRDFVDIAAACCAALLLLVLVVLAIALLVHVPQWESSVRQISAVKDRVEAENELLKTLLQLAGGALLIVGFYFTWKTIRVSQEGQITDRFSKAIDHLGSTSLEIRLGGIYALVRICLRLTKGFCLCHGDPLCLCAKSLEELKRRQPSHRHSVDNVLDCIDGAIGRPN